MTIQAQALMANTSRLHDAGPLEIRIMTSCNQRRRVSPNFRGHSEMKHVPLVNCRASGESCQL